MSEAEQRRPLFHSERIAEIQSQTQRWQQSCLSEADRRQEGTYVTASGIPVKLLYTPADIADLDYEQDLGFPGQPPYVRGVYPNMYRGRPFTMRQLTGFGSPEDLNRRIKFMLEHGGTGVNILFDMPTIRGYDSDAPQAEGNVGQCGTSVDSIEDIAAIFQDIPIDKVSASIVTHLPSTTTIIFCMYLAMAQERGIDPNLLAGTTQDDFIMETAVGSAPEVIPPRHSFRLQCDAVEFIRQQAPRWNPISYNGYNLREAGTDAVQEVGVAIANAIATLEELIRRGNDVDFIAPRLSFFWDLCNDFFEEIAKCRASRRVWYKIMRDRFRAKNPRSYLMRFHVQTAGISLPAIEPHNNIVRSTIQGLAAILGGAQSLHIDSYDEAFSVPTEEAALVSLRAQQIIQAETNIMNTVDPLAGSYFVEYLTNEMERRIFDYVAEIERMGGLVAAVDKGWLHRQIAETAYKQQKAIESGEMKVVGVNFLRSEAASAQPIDVFCYPEDTEEKQRAKLKKLRQSRDNHRVRSCLEEVRRRCQTGENVMPAVLEAVKARATLGEIHGIYRDVFGLWQFPLI
ncbi:MAG TPA: methylmalonyl-CoA mutase [Dehalococcoidia bacterium]|nr:methylmalonyl-CoA mutase [Dehalococcoidia bacterium]